jgi:methanogenic corrinoid protein MtbC1
MVYIRSKRVKGIEYAYLVRSEWDQKKGSSVQHTIKYLGRADGVAVHDIPEAFRNDSRILSFLSAHSSENQAKKEALLERLRSDLFESLCEADRERALRIAIKYQSLFSLIEFYEDLLTPVLYRVGDLWAQNRLSVATEHVCSNIASGLIDALNESSGTKSPKGTIFICTPEGEIHHLASKVIESVLRQKGFKVYNVSPSAPSDEIARYVRDCDPNVVMISVTLQEHVNAAQRLVERIREEHETPVLLGGAAVRQLADKERRKLESLKLTLVYDNSLERLVSTVRSAVASG